MDEWETLANEISDAFEWKGSKIDWSKSCKHESTSLVGDFSAWITSIMRFIGRPSIYDQIKVSKNIFYLNDSSLNFAVCLNPAQLDNFIKLAIENIPQHHYFFDRVNKWCLVISAEGYIDFGFSSS